MKREKVKPITLEEFKRFPNDEIFLGGEGTITKWVAVKGGIDDWAIYSGPKEHGFDKIRSYGSKIYIESLIKKLVPCTDEVFKLYRY